MLGTQLYIGEALPTAEKMLPVTTQENWMKPLGGFWTLSWENGTSAWVEWCTSEHYGAPHDLHWYLLTPREDTRIYTIDSEADLTSWLEIFGLPYTYAHTLSIFHGKRYPDFERMAEVYDGIHLTKQGAWKTHCCYPNDLNSWDVESTLWLRWCFYDVQEVTK